MDEILFAVLHALDLAQIVRRVLVDVVVQPVFVQQVSMGAPAEQRRLLRIIVRIVVDGHMDGQALGHVPLVLGIQRVLVVFRVAGDKDLPSVLGAQ